MGDEAKRSVACASTSTASPATQPNLRLSGHSAPFAVGQDAAEDARARRGAGDLLDLLDAIDGEERHAELHARGRCRAPS